MYYTYKALVIDVYDGDTITCIVDLGFDVKMKIKVRLFGIDTPELRGEEREAGLVVRDIVRELILDKEIVLETIKDRTGKYGRYLGNVFIDVSNTQIIVENKDVYKNDMLNLNEWLIHNDYAKRYEV